MSRRRRHQLRTAALASLALLVAGNALARGGVDGATVAASAVLASAALWLAAVRREGEAAEVPLLAVVLVAGVAAIAGQLVPLPAGLLRWLSPNAWETFRDALEPAGLFPTARPLSLDPGATALELAKACSFVSVAVAAALLASRRERRDAVLTTVALSGVVVVAVVYGAALAGFGPLLAPHFPFVNPNHLAGFLQLAAWPALAFALRARGRARVAWLVAFGFMASGVFLSLSRAGIAAFFVGAGLFVVLAPERPLDSGRASRDLRSGRTVMNALRSSKTVVGAAVFLALALASWLALGPIVEEMSTLAETSTTTVKLGLWPAAAGMVGKFALTGIGRGAFPTVFPAYDPSLVRVTFTHVENEWIQLPLDLGVVGVALVVAFAWTWVQAARGAGLSRPVAGALAGTGALALHNLFDFSLEIPGVAVAFAAVMGALSVGMPSVRIRPWAARAGAAAVLALAVLGLVLHRAHPTDEDAARVVAAASADEAIARARDALRWHPADYVPHAAAGAKLASEGRCEEALPWLERAMLRNPAAPEPHRAAAGCLARAGQDDLARREFRLAFLYGDRGALAAAFQAYPAPGALLEIAPDSPDGLLAAGALLRERPAEAREAYRRAWEDYRDARSLGPLADVTLALGDRDEALRLARTAQQVSPSDARGFVVASRALDAAGDADGALAELELGAARLPGDAWILTALGQRYLSARQFSQARATFEKIVARDGPAVARRRLLVARALEGQERHVEALRELQAARDAAPDDLTVLESFSRVAALAGRYDEAIEALEIAARKPAALPGAYEARLAELRSARDAQRVRWLEQGLGSDARR